MDLGSGDRDRTCDTRLMSPLLYRLSYAAREVAGTGFEPATSGL